MKYKVGNIVRIKSFQWWDEQEKDKDGDAVFEFKKMNIMFYSHIASQCCGKIGEIMEILKYNAFQYGISFNKISYYYFHEDWIEGEVGRVNIPLRVMKNEI